MSSYVHGNLRAHLGVSVPNSIPTTGREVAEPGGRPVTKVLTTPHEVDERIRLEHLFGSYTIFEGTSEVQRLVIARAVSGIHIP